MCCNRRDVFKHGRDKVAKDKRLSMLAWKYGLEDFRPNEERGRSESNLEPLPFLLGAHHSNYSLHTLGKVSPRSAALSFVPRYNMQYWNFCRPLQTCLSERFACQWSLRVVERWPQVGASES